VQERVEGNHAKIRFRNYPNSLAGMLKVGHGPLFDGVECEPPSAVRLVSVAGR
jgi:hypothetical protein